MTNVSTNGVYASLSSVSSSVFF